MNSVSNVATSRSGSMLPSGWGTVSSAKRRTTWISASFVFTAERKPVVNWVVPLAPFFSPATSTNSMVAWTVLFGEKIAEQRSSRWSGTLTMPT